VSAAPDPLHAVFVDWQGPGRVESGHCSLPDFLVGHAVVLNDRERAYAIDVITAGGAYEALTPENRLVTVWRTHQRIFASEPA
jgi:hypothetical protein